MMLSRRGFFAGLVALATSVVVPKFAFAAPKKTEAVSALSKINEKRFYMLLRADIERVICEFAFDVNDEKTRELVRTSVAAVLEHYEPVDYCVICDTANNTVERILRGELWVDIMVRFEGDLAYTNIPVRMTGMGIV